MVKGTVFNIQHFSTEDGPGIRTVVFLKGCPLRCRWCANPESQKAAPELAWTKTDCIGCQGCLRNLPKNGIAFTPEGLSWNREVPAPDAAYTDRVCPTAALHVIGEEKTVEECLSEVEKDHTFYENSGGGLTVSGGEPLQQAAFTTALLREAKAHHIHTVMESSACGREEDLLTAAAHLDLLYTDVKAVSDGLHKEYTGVSNAGILSNIRAVRRHFPALPIVIRTPVIPGVNDAEEEIKGIAAFVDTLRKDGTGNAAEVRHELLQYHRLGQPKYEALRRPYPLGDVTLSDAAFRQCKAWAGQA